MPINLKNNNSMVQRIAPVLVFLAKNYPGNSIGKSSEATLFWSRLIRIGLIEKRVLVSYDEDDKVQGVMCLRTVNSRNFKPLDPFEADAQGDMLLVDVAVFGSENARFDLMQQLDNINKTIELIGYIRKGDTRSLRIITRAKLNRLAAIIFKTPGYKFIKQQN